MSLFHLAWQNFLLHARRYGALILSLAFTVFVFFNFENLEYSGSLGGLSADNLEKIKILIDIVKVVLVCFMVSMIAYASHVFLKSQKKEFGVYVFLGLTSGRISVLYMIENLIVGIVSILTGVLCGTLFSYLFSMIFVKISSLGIAAGFSISWRAVVETCLLFFLIYGLITLWGMRSIQKSSVKDLLSASRQNEKVNDSSRFLILKAIIGCAILFTGYYFAIKDGGMDVLGNAMIATVCVILGTYLIFGGFLPFLLQTMQNNKRFLLSHRRLLWVNSLVFRMKQNYRSYAMVSILLICAVTALGCGFTLNHRIEAIQQYSMQYDVQILSLDPNAEAYFNERLPEQEMRTIVPVAEKNEQLFVPYSSVSSFDISEPKENECILLSKRILLSLYTDPTHNSTELEGRKLTCIEDVRTAVLGFMQDKMEVPVYVINDSLFDQVFPQNERLYLYNYKFEGDEPNIEISTEDPMVVGIFQMDENNDSYVWLNTIFTFCVFLFIVFLIAACSILFIKQYNDSFEEIEAYRLLQKIGVDRKVLKHSIIMECSFQFGLDFLIMCISSYFSLMALSKVAGDPLGSVFVISNLIILLFMILCDLICIKAVKNTLLSKRIA